MKKTIFTLIICFMATAVWSATTNRISENNPLKPPFCETFDNFRDGNLAWDDFDRFFQVIDADNDGRSWGFYNYNADPYGRCAYMLYSIDNYANDDWLVLRAIKLKGGKYYRFSVMASTFGEGIEQLYEVKWGLYPEVAELNRPLVPVTAVSTFAFQTQEGWVTPEEDGIYYIGVHGISNTKTSYLFIDNIALSAAMEPTVPDGVAGLQFINDPNGAPEVTIAFSAPVTDIAGNAIKSLTKLTVIRDGKTIAEYSNPTPGQTFSIVDSPDAEGTYNYEITAENADGTGLTVKRSHFVGMEAPQAPVIDSILELDDEGTIKMKWQAPATDTNGSAINPEVITYNIYDLNEDIFVVQDMISGTEATFAVDLPYRQQRLLTLGLTAMVGDKESELAVSEVFPIGSAYTLPHHNSFTLDDYYAYVMSFHSKDNVSWGLFDNHSFPDAQDGDNGYIAMEATAPGQRSELRTGKISLVDAVHPAVSFFTFYYLKDENEINVSVIDCATGVKTTIANVKLSSFSRVGWNKVKCDLSAFAGKTVQICLEGVIATHGYIPVDNMLIDELANVDLCMVDATAPRSVRSGEEFTVEAIVLNNGAEDIDKYTIELWHNGALESELTCGPLAVNQEATVSIPARINATSPMANTYEVRAIADGEGNADDNVFGGINVVFLASSHPVVTDLAATENGQNVMLTWSAPDLEKAAPLETQDDIEGYAPYATKSFGGWTTVDMDGGYIGGFQNYDMPGMPVLTQQSFWVMNNSAPFDFLTFHSGSQALVQMYGLSEDKKSEVPADDWLISPELYGGAQIIRFWAASLDDNYGYDTFEVYASTTDTALSSFELIVPSTETSVEWQEFYAALPEGTRYFAIRCTSQNTYMLMLDDFEFIAKGTPRELTLKGYNIYRNGTLQNEEPVEATSYATARSLQSDVYCVTAVYDQGESAASNEVRLGSGGIDSATAASASVSVEGREIVVRGATGPFTVTTVDGRTVYRGTDSRIAVAPGFYIVAGPTTAKVFVR